MLHFPVHLLNHVNMHAHEEKRLWHHSTKKAAQAVVVVEKMLYFASIVLLTFASTFMAADSVAHIWRSLEKSRVALILYGVWVAAFALSVLDADWLSTLGFVHALFFIGCWLLVPQKDGAFGPQHSDYVQIPLTLYVPAYFVLWLIQGWLW